MVPFNERNYCYVVRNGEYGEDTSVDYPMQG